MTLPRKIAIFGLVAALALPACSSSGGSDSSDSTTTEATGGGGGGGEATTTAATDDPTTTEAAPDDDLDQVLADAADATVATTGFSIVSEAQLDIGGQQVGLTIDGSVDYDSLLASLELGVDQDGTASVQELRSDGTTLWVRVESDEVTVPDGKTWVEGDVDLLVDSGTFDPDGVLGVLYALRAAEGTEAGETEEIDGTETTKYTTEIDYDTAVEAAGDDAEAFEQALSLTADGDIALLVDVWVGEDGIVRRFSLDIEAPSGVPLDGTYDMDLSDIGGEIEPGEEPPADETLTGPDADAFLEQVIG